MPPVLPMLAKSIAGFDRLLTCDAETERAVPHLTVSTAGFGCHRPDLPPISPMSTVSDQIRYSVSHGGIQMSGAGLLERARRAAGLSQDQLAQRAHTSRTTLSAYENGRKSPSLSTAERLLAESGFELDTRPRITFRQAAGARGRSYQVPDHLPRLSPEHALATVQLPLTLNWSEPDREFDLTDRNDRARLYEIVLREGRPDDVLAYIDGALLVDIWSELVLPRDLRAAWQTVITAVTQPGTR